MSDSPVNPYEKPKKLQIKLPPIHVEAIHARSSVRYGAANLLCEIAEKSFPQVTYNDEFIEKLRAIGRPLNQDAPDAMVAALASSAKEQSNQPKQPEALPNETSVEAVALAPVSDLGSRQKENQAAQTPDQAREIDQKNMDITAIRQAVKDALEGKKAA